MAVPKRLLKKAKNGMGKKKNGNGGGMRVKAPRVLAQGAAAAPRRAMGTKPSVPRGLPCNVWNATSSSHAGLPRAIGPYTVVRTTKMFTSKSPLLIFGSFSTNFTNSASSSDAQDHLSAGFVSGPKQWSNVCCMGAEADISTSDFKAGKIGSSTYSELHTIPLPGVMGNEVLTAKNAAGTAWTHTFQNANTTAVPSAVSVQVICPETVQTAAGSAIAAVCPVRLDLCGSERTWSMVGDELLSYFRPRIMTGGKLALRGVQMDSLPLSMTDVSDFRELFRVSNYVSNPAKLTWTDRYGPVQAVDNVSGEPAWTEADKSFNVPIHPEGWAPMVYYSPYNAERSPETRLEMTFMVTIEWRVRFDISNPAASSHITHPITTDAQWHHHIKQAQAALPGVIDIVEKVANAGLGVYKGLQAAGAL